MFLWPHVVCVRFHAILQVVLLQKRKLWPLVRIWCTTRPVRIVLHTCSHSTSGWMNFVCRISTKRHMQSFGAYPLHFALGQFSHVRLKEHRDVTMFLFTILEYFEVVYNQLPFITELNEIHHRDPEVNLYQISNKNTRVRFGWRAPLTDSVLHRILCDSSLPLCCSMMCFV